jgi:hypothetical protein
MITPRVIAFLKRMNPLKLEIFGVTEARNTEFGYPPSCWENSSLTTVIAGKQPTEAALLRFV